MENAGLNRESLLKKVIAWMPRDWPIAGVRIRKDASDYFEVGYGDVLLLGGKAYLIRNSAREGRFGLDDEVKHWVKRAIALDSGEMCIICVQAIRFLRDHGEKHGDIRRDHILIDNHSGHYRWIDFDYNYRHGENIYGYDLYRTAHQRSAGSSSGSIGGRHPCAHPGGKNRFHDRRRPAGTFPQGEIFVRQHPQ